MSDMESKYPLDSRPEGTYPSWQTYPAGVAELRNNICLLERVNGDGSITQFSFPRDEAGALMHWLRAELEPGTFSSLFEMTAMTLVQTRITAAKLDSLIAFVKKEHTQMAADLAALQAQVAQNTQVEGSAVALIQGIAAQLAASKNDPAAVQALVDQLGASATALAAAVAANTPAAASSPTPAPTNPPVSPAAPAV